MRWESRVVTGTAPSARVSHSAVLKDSRIFLFGGNEGNAIQNDMHILDLSTSAYLPQVRFARATTKCSHQGKFADSIPAGVIVKNTGNLEIFGF